MGKCGFQDWVVRMWLGIIPTDLFFAIVDSITIFKDCFVCEVKELKYPNGEIVVQLNLPTHYAGGSAIREESKGGANDLRLLRKPDIQEMFVFCT